MKRRPYPKYKDSGVEWLGEVPEHWQILPLKHVLPPLESGVSVNADQVAPADDETPGVLKTSCVYGNRFRAEESKQVVEQDLDRLACPVTRDSVIISRMNTPDLVGSSGYVTTDYPNLYLPDRLWIARFTRTSTSLGKYAWYLLISDPLSKLTGALATGTSGSMKNLSQESFLDIDVAMPSVAEQELIVDFLDRDTERIDTLVEKKRTLIERLKEKRTALISRTVTRGLPPDAARAAGLDPHPKFKPSGIGWLGDVPEHWEVKPLGRLVRFAGGATPDKGKPEYWDGIIPWVSPKDMKRMRIVDVSDHISDDALRNSPLTLLPPGSVLIVVRGMILAHSFPVAITEVPVTINQDMKALATGREVQSEFLLWLLTGMADIFVSIADESAHGTRKLETEVLARTPLAVPPEPEQSAIVEFLARESSRTDQMIAKVETARERLEEYRSALITAAVTGKIDVRNTRLNA